MAEGGDESGEKTHEPTQQKLDDARKKGDVPQSKDLAAAAAYFGLLIALFVGGGPLLQSGGEILMTFLSRPEDLAPRILTPGGGSLGLGVASEAVIALLPIFAGPFILVFVVIFAQRAFVFAPDKLMPKLNRISLISGVKNKFGITGIVEFLKSVVKMIAVSALLFTFILAHRDEVFGLARATPAMVASEMARLSMGLLAEITAIAIVIALIDLVWQRVDHARKLRMSNQDLKEENKRSEGDPMVKSQRRQRAQEIATNKMMLEVPNADVVIVNPTHYAVALKWNRAQGGAPIIVAKGVDEIALRIREVAEAANVPIHSDPPTARALEASVDIGKEIEPTHYQAVAAAIRFSEAMRKKARERNG